MNNMLTLINAWYKIIVIIWSVVMLSACATLSSEQDSAVSKKIKPYKAINDHNPIMTHTFGADPSALVYKGRVYIYMTGDTLIYDDNGQVLKNDYSNINTIRVVSSADMVNWTYHEPVKAAGSEGAATWANFSWAPAAIYKQVDGKDTFFLYFSNSANGIGVLTADSPLGPWVDPLDRALLTRQSPNCSDVTWLFDPAVFIDDDGKGYLYFGGGVPKGKERDPGTARVVLLGDDMISLAGDPVKLDVPFLFEASGINKIDGKYFYSYCTNWDVTEAAKGKFGIDNAVIAVMSSRSPMGPFTHEGTILKNPGVFFGVWGNNHHSIFEFNGKWYIAYHSQVLEGAMGLYGKGYRVTHIDAVTVRGGKFRPAAGTRKGVAQIGRLNPFVRHSGAESGVSAGLTFDTIKPVDSSEPIEYAAVSEKGAWLGVYGADFGEAGANNISVYTRAEQQDEDYRIEIMLGSPSGKLVGAITVPPGSSFANHTAILTETIKGVQDVYFAFYGDSLYFGGWQFSE